MPKLTELGETKDQIGDKIVIHQPRYRRAKNLGTGQLAGSEGSLYLCPTAMNAEVVTMSFVNTHTSALTMYLYVKTSGGTSRHIAPKALSLAAGAAYVYDYTVTLGPGDDIRGYASTASKIDYIISGFEEAQSTLPKQ